MSIRRGWRLLLAAFGVALLLAALAFFLLPLKRVGDVRVEDADVVAGPAPAPAETARRIAVTFSTPDDLAQLRDDVGLGFIVARLSACGGDAGTEEVITQRAEYRPERGRVQALGPAGDRHRYRVTFDDRLVAASGSQVRLAPAIGNPVGLCFALDGASMGLGKLWSNEVRLRALR